MKQGNLLVKNGNWRLIHSQIKTDSLDTDLGKSRKFRNYIDEKIANGINRNASHSSRETC